MLSVGVSAVSGASVGAVADDVPDVVPEVADVPLEDVLPLQAVSPSVSARLIIIVVSFFMFVNPFLI